MNWLKNMASKLVAQSVTLTDCLTAMWIRKCPQCGSKDVIISGNIGRCKSCGSSWYLYSLDEMLNASLAVGYCPRKWTW